MIEVGGMSWKLPADEHEALVRAAVADVPAVADYSLRDGMVVVVQAPPGRAREPFVALPADGGWLVVAEWTERPGRSAARLDAVAAEAARLAKASGAAWRGLRTGNPPRRLHDQAGGEALVQARR